MGPTGDRLESVRMPTTPGGPNNEAANGAATGPPARPRDGLHAIGDLTECFQL
jgi:hypothetical protein